MYFVTGTDLAAKEIKNSYPAASDFFVDAYGYQSQILNKLPCLDPPLFGKKSNVLKFYLCLPLGYNIISDYYHSSQIKWDGWVELEGEWVVFAENKY